MLSKKQELLKSTTRSKTKKQKIPKLSCASYAFFVNETHVEGKTARSEWANKKSEFNAIKQLPEIKQPGVAKLIWLSYGISSNYLHFVHLLCLLLSASLSTKWARLNDEWVERSFKSVFVCVNWKIMAREELEEMFALPFSILITLFN